MKQWLGKLILKSDIEILNILSSKFGFNLNFEGGEAETFLNERQLNKTQLKLINF